MVVEINIHSNCFIGPVRVLQRSSRGGARKPPGRQIEEDYKFVKRIGGGSFGDVYLAEDRKHPGVKVRWGGRLGV